MMNYSVIEDNGGGLTMFVFDESGACVWGGGGYEHRKGSCRENIASLEAGDNPVTGWDDGMDDPQAEWDNVQETEYGYKLVADQDGIYPENMGRAAQIEFDVEAE